MTMTEQAKASQSPAVDKERLRQKYLEERNKRLRADGNDQYLRVAGQLAHYLDDPYTPVVPRDPKTDHVTFAFIGGGFAGLATAARLSASAPGGLLLLSLLAVLCRMAWLSISISFFYLSRIPVTIVPFLLF